MALADTGLYEFCEDNTGIWVKLKDSVQQQRVFVHSGVVTAANMNDDRIFSTLDDYWWKAEKALRLPSMFPLDIASHKKNIEETRGYKKLLWIKDLLFRVRYSDYVQLLREVAVPAFLAEYPKGRIHIIRIDEGLVDLLHAIDLTGISGVYSIPEIGQSIRQSVIAGQGSELGSLGGNVLQAVLSGFYPNVYGIVIARLSFLLVFQCYPVLKIHKHKRGTMPSLPDALRGNRILERNLALQNMIANERDLKTELGESRLRHMTRWGSEDIDKLVEWTVERINALYLSLINPSLFLKDDESIDFIKQRQFYLTIDRIVSETIAVNTERDTYIRKQVFFDILDKYATLSAEKVDLGKRERTYLRLLKKSHFKGRLEPLMAHMPSRFRTYLATTAEKIYDLTVQQAVEGVWSKSRLDQDRRLIQLKKFDKTRGKYIEREHRDTFEDFTAELIHGIRNSLHGYRMMNKTYECLLSIHSCEVSNVLPDLATVYLFALLSDPDEFVQHTWSKDIGANRS